MRISGFPSGGWEGNPAGCDSHTHIVRRCTEIAVSRTQVLAVECADGTRYYSDGQQVERFIAGENPDGTVRYGYGTEEQYGHDFKKG